MLSTGSLILNDIIESIDVPASAYEAAERRYLDLGKWLQDRTKAGSAQFDPHVFAQGSFRLGTVTRPWKLEDYDLDLACKLRKGIAKLSHTQEYLKRVVGTDLEIYRRERGIKEKPEEKHRCWRINYQDDLKFHMDIVPAIPETEDQRQVLLARMVKSGAAQVLAQDVAEHAMAITDDRHPVYRSITIDWQISNQEGYALWFESRMRQAQELLKSTAAIERVAKIDELPVFRWKTPLQRCIQVLKRHRDMMFETEPDTKPISAIITTLAARSYAGEADVESAMSRIVANMGAFVNPSAPRVPNPVNSEEDFADKWPTDLRLEKAFWDWLDNVKGVFDTFNKSRDLRSLSETARRRFGVKLRDDSLLGRAASIASGMAHTSPDGRIGDSGVRNQPHKFYGQEPV